MSEMNSENRRLEEEDFSDLSSVEAIESSDDVHPMPDLEDLARFFIISGLIPSQKGLLHNDCSICEQYENAVIDYVKSSVDAPPSASEEAKNILMLTHEIWLEHHLDDYRQYLETRRQRREFSARLIERSMEESRPPTQIAKDEEIKSLETKIYEAKDDKESCVICLNDLQGGDLTTRTSCKHLFHNECLTRWLKTNISCPMCRKNAITGENMVT